MQYLAEWSEIYDFLWRNLVFVCCMYVHGQTLCPTKIAIKYEYHNKTWTSFTNVWSKYIISLFLVNTALELYAKTVVFYLWVTYTVYVLSCA